MDEVTLINDSYKIKLTLIIVFISLHNSCKRHVKRKPNGYQTIINVLNFSYKSYMHVLCYGMDSYIVFCLYDIAVSCSVLNPSSITALCKCLSMEEAGLFGLQLGLPLSIKEDLFQAPNPPKELAFRLLHIWSGSKHSSRRVKKYV